MSDGIQIRVLLITELKPDSAFEDVSDPDSRNTSLPT
jgi:hypothetical protein